MELDLFRFIEIGVLGMTLPIAGVVWRRLWKHEREHIANDHKIQQLIDLNEEAKQWREEIGNLVISELGGKGQRDRLTRLEQEVKDLQK